MSGEPSRLPGSFSDGRTLLPLLSLFKNHSSTWTVHCGDGFAGDIAKGEARTANEHHLLDLARVHEPPAGASSLASRSVRSWWLLGEVRVPRFVRFSKSSETETRGTRGHMRKHKSAAALRGKDIGASRSGASGGKDTSGESFAVGILDKVVAALQKGSEAPAMSWLSLGRDPNQADSAGDPLLHTACAHGSVELVQALIDKGASPNEKSLCVPGHSPLHVAVIHARPAVAAVLLKCGADANVADSCGTTPLMLCATRGVASIVPTLLEAGAAVAQRDNAGGTATMHAQAHRHKQVLQLLKRHTQSQRKRAQALAAQAEREVAAKAASGETGGETNGENGAAESLGATPAPRPASGRAETAALAMASGSGATPTPDGQPSHSSDEQIPGSVVAPGGVVVRVHGPNGKPRRFGLSGRLRGWVARAEQETP